MDHMTILTESHLDTPFPVDITGKNRSGPEFRPVENNYYNIY